MTSPILYREHVAIPPRVAVVHQDTLLVFQGPLGSTRMDLAHLDRSGGALVSVGPGEVVVATPSRARARLYRALVLQHLQGVVQGRLVYLKILGTGYRATLTGDLVAIRAGASHDVVYKVPMGVRVFVLDPTLLCVWGVDSHQVTQIAAAIRAIRPPGAYKGKGIRLVSERVLLKAGKRK